MSIFRSVKRMVNQLSIKYKLFMILLLISIIPLSLVSYSSESFMFRSSTEYAASVSSQYTRFVSREIASYLESLNQSFDNLFSNPDFQRFLDTPVSDLTGQTNDIIKFRPIIKNALQFHPDVLGVLYLDKPGKVYFYSNQKTLDASFSFKADSLYNSVFDTTEPELLPPHPMNYVLYSKDRVFSYVWPIVNLNTGKTESWFIFEINADKLTGMLSGNRQEAGGQLLLYHVPSGTSVDTAEADPDVMQVFRTKLAEMPENSGHFLFTADGAEYQASYADLPGTGWKLVWTAPLSGIEKGAQQAFLLTLLIAAVSLIIAIIVAFPAMNSVLRPLYRLKQGMQSLGRGVYVPIAMTNRQDEIGYLVQSYNQTLSKLQKMEREVYQAKLREKEREVLQLQAQINPHFLFNTLETIESYALRNNGDAVGDMVQSVSRMMRYTVSNNSGWATVKEEMDYIRNFMKIHDYRHGREVRTSFEIDPAALDVRIMKLTIQPYIENAFKYGWSPNMSADEFSLRVVVKAAAGGLLIIVHDTGAGMPADVLHKFRQLIAASGETEDPYFRRHTGIYNAYRRFVLMYGDDALFRIDSAPGQGTRIEMFVPSQASGAADIRPEQPGYGPERRNRLQ